jgi:DNA-directed RNA polymerase subunit RPC12/RpoP
MFLLRNLVARTAVNVAFWGALVGTAVICSGNPRYIVYVPTLGPGTKMNCSNCKNHFILPQGVQHGMVISCPQCRTLVRITNTPQPATNTVVVQNPSGGTVVVQPQSQQGVHVNYNNPGTYVHPPRQAQLSRSQEQKTVVVMKPQPQLSRPAPVVVVQPPQKTVVVRPSSSTGYVTAAPVVQGQSSGYNYAPQQAAPQKPVAYPSPPQYNTDPMLPPAYGQAFCTGCGLNRQASMAFCGGCGMKHA